MSRFGTIAIEGGTRAFRDEGDHAVLLPAADVGDLLRDPAMLRVSGERIASPSPDQLRPPVLRPEKIVCAGLNYREHAREVGKDIPTHPTLFAKFASALVGPAEPIRLPSRSVSDRVDWEAELVVVIGREVFQADASTAHAAIFGYTAMNDVSMRDWQKRTEEWLQGKNFERSTPLGPLVVSADELDVGAGLEIETRVGERLVQSGSTSDLIFDPVALVEYVSSIMSLQPGDLIATGTPAGVGASRQPPEFLANGDILRTRISGIGELINRCIEEDQL